MAWLDENDLTPPPGDDSLDAHQAQHLASCARCTTRAGCGTAGRTAGGLGGPDVLRAIVGEEVVGRGLDEPGLYSMVEVLAPTMIDYARPELAAEMVPRLLSGRNSGARASPNPAPAATSRRSPPGPSAGRRLGGQRPEGVDELRPVLHPLRPAHPHRRPATPSITAFFVDMDTPGITVRPLRTMHGVDEFCEVFFDDVVVPADRMLGKPGDGWQLAMDLLPYERSTCFWQRIAYLYSRLDALLDDVKGLGQAADSDWAPRIWPCTRCAAAPARPSGGWPTGTAGPGDLDRQGPAGRRRTAALRHRTRSAARRDRADDTAWRTEYLYSRAATIYGGTAEVQRNIIARRLLDLGKE